MSQADSRVEKARLLRRKTGRAVVLLVSLLAGRVALAQKVTVQFDQSADFSKYKTFAIRNGSLNSRSPALNSELIKKQIEADIRRDLTARGLTEVTGLPERQGILISTWSITLARSPGANSKLILQDSGVGARTG